MKRITVDHRHDDGSGRFIKVHHKQGRRMEDLHLHLADLEFCGLCLAALNGVANPLSISQQALWEIAIVRFLKCFGDSSARFSLVAEKVYKLEPAEALSAFNFFKNYRNKHLIHDENSYAQSVLGAVLNGPTHARKIERLTCAGLIGGIYGPENYQNLGLLVEKARSWAASEYEKIAANIQEELEALPYSILVAMESVLIEVPDDQDIRKDRRDRN